MAAALAALRTRVSALRNPQSGEELSTGIIESHELSLALFEQLAVSVSNAETSINALVTSNQAMRTQVNALTQNRAETGRKPLSESKCISNLKVLGCDKSEFKNWNEKLINAVSQSFGAPWRKFMKHLNRQLGQERKVLSQSELQEVEGAEDALVNDRYYEDL